MKNVFYITSDKGNCYFVDVENGIVQFVHPQMKKVLVEGACSDASSYYREKLSYLELHNSRKSEEKKYKLSRITADDVRFYFANTPQVVIEVTDYCNMKCKYCTYSDLYDNHDMRNTRNANFNDVKCFLNYFFSIRKKYKVTSNELRIAFYGGEPLLNMNLIKQIIAYLEENFANEENFAYNMTTNGLLLKPNMDFLAKKNFDLSISLDGGDKASSYRVNLKNEEVFNDVVENIDLLKFIYPNYFKEKVSFSSVLHDRNTLDEIYEFFQGRYNKVPIVGSLNNIGISNSYKSLYDSMYNQNTHPEHKDYVVDKKETFWTGYFSFVKNLIFSYYPNYLSLLFNKESEYIIPTATCLPFERKIYLTTTGKILPCEKIGHKVSLGCLSDSTVCIDFEEIARKYNERYEHLLDEYCSKCYLLKNCSVCAYSINGDQCPFFCDENKFVAFLKEKIDVIESNEKLYSSICKMIF